MSLFTRFPAFRFLVFGSLAIVALSSPLRAQSDSIANWKPNVGDWFECQVSDFVNCGDYMCSGLDTVMFVIVDTAFNADSQHPSAVLAATSAIGLHITRYEWGNGWDSINFPHEYSDTTLTALGGPRLIETSFGGYDVDYHGWTQVPFVRDTSVIFQGISYSASVATSTSAEFIPKLGWFLYLAGYETNGACSNPCLQDFWTLSLIAASKVHSIVQSEGHSNTLLLLNGHLLQLVNIEADHITLMDFLGRIIDDWRFPASGPREITLNVADVPSGVYFLRVSAAGVDEMRKVVIVH